MFERVEKYDGEIVQDLTTSQVKQIGGRAGRFGTVHSTGKVTT